MIIWTIRIGEPRDIEIIADFNQAMALETENKILEKNTIQRGVLRLINNPALGFYLVGGIDTHVHGSLMITYEWTDWRDGLFWWIQSVYVEPAYRRKGLFRALYNHVWKIALKNEDVRGIRLYVEKDNTSARKTYELLRMKETPYRLYERLVEQTIERNGYAIDR